MLDRVITLATLSIAETQRLTRSPSSTIGDRGAALGDPAVGLGAFAAQAPAIECLHQRLQLRKRGAGAKAVELERSGVGRR